MNSKATITQLIMACLAFAQLLSPLAKAEGPYEFTLEQQSRMIVEAENLLADLEERMNLPHAERVSNKGRFRRALAAMGKDQWSRVAGFTGRMLNRYPEMLPGFVVYNALKFGIVIPTMLISGFWKEGMALGAAPDSAFVVAAYALTRFPYDIISNRVRTGYWFHQIFRRRDHLLGIGGTAPWERWPYFSQHPKFQFFEVRIPIGVIDGEIQYDFALLPVRRLGALRLMTELLLPRALLSDTSEAPAEYNRQVIEQEWLREETLTAVLAEEMGEDEFDIFYDRLLRQTSDPRLRQMVMLEWLLENSMELTELNRGLLNLANRQRNPIARALLMIEMTRS
ncbi:MAG: hypothetical protein AAF202_10340, partial [Pseudomonadota bacterium]